MNLSKERMYQAILDKDTAFEGIFFTAVKTTGIFCRPSCTARKPKPENVDFFATTQECITRGYRPCKVCRPLENLHHTPDVIRTLIQEITDNPTQKLSDHDLRQRGLEPSTLRRWFLKHHGMTFHAFQRMFRINSAFQKIQQGQSVTETAFQAGFESLSGFQDSFKKIFGVSPKHSKVQGVIQLTRLQTPLGTMIACTTQQGLCLLEFADRKMLETELKAIAKIFNSLIIQSHNPIFESLQCQLDEYFSGQRQTFTIPLDTRGTDFQEAVWQILQTIPFGETRSYRQQAELLGKPNSVRAVANANGMNRIAILIPCHRVIGANGNLTGYGGGLWRKRFLLALENQNR